MVNIVELYTINGPVCIDTKELDSGITNLKSYSCEGDWIAESRVFRDTLFASRELAEQNYNRVLFDTHSRLRRRTDSGFDSYGCGQYFYDILMDSGMQSHHHESIYVN